MSKGLEAFNRILGNEYFNLIITSRTNGKKQYAHDIAIVEKELKALDIIRKRISPLGRVSFMPMSEEEYKIIQEVLNSET